jgi:putative tricarboxylic transport membrane protein
VRELGSALGLLLLSVVALVQARDLPFGSLRSPGPGFFPVLLAAGLGVIALVLVARARAAARAAATDGAADRGAPAPPAPAAPAARVLTAPAPEAAQAAGGDRRKLVLVIAALVAYTAVFERLGFVLSTVGLLLVLFRVVQSHGWWIAVAESAGTALAAHVLFRVWLGVRLPPGPWGF